jgi:hypothetical protein
MAGVDHVEFSAILVHGKGVSTMEIRVLDREFVRFRGTRYRIELVRCGSSLA